MMSFADIQLLEHVLRLRGLLYDQVTSDSDLCDVTVITQGVNLKAHWCVLVACPYFDALYRSNLKERKYGEIHIEIGQSEAVRSVIKYIYTGHLNITKDNVEELLKISDYLQIEKAKELCHVFLLNEPMTADNCVRLCLISSLYNLERVFEEAYFVLIASLPQVMTGDDVLKVSATAIQTLISDETLSYVPVVDFFDLIVRWTLSDCENRELEFHDLFCSLDLNRLRNTLDRDHILGISLMQKHEDCLMLVKEQSKKPSKHQSKKPAVNNVDAICVPVRHKLDMSQPMLLCARSNVVSLYGYIPSEQRWTNLFLLPESVIDPLMCSNHRKSTLYLIDQMRYSSGACQIHQFNVSKKDWQHLSAPFPAELQNIAIKALVCLDNSDLFVIVCGIDTTHSNPANNNVNNKYGAVLLKYNHVAQRFDKECFLFLCTLATQIQTCTVQTNELYVLASKPSKSVKCKLVCYDTYERRAYDLSAGAEFQNFLFAYGDKLFMAKPGKYGPKEYRLNHQFPHCKPSKNFHITLMPEAEERMEFAFTAYGNELYVLGGKSTMARNMIESNFAFNLKTKTWNELSPLPGYVSAATSCVLRVPQDLVQCHVECPHCIFQLTERIHRSTSPLSEDFDEEWDNYDDEDYDDSVGDDFCDMFMELAPYQIEPYQFEPTVNDYYPFNHLDDSHDEDDYIY